MRSSSSLSNIFSDSAQCSTVHFRYLYSVYHVLAYYCTLYSFYFYFFHFIVSYIYTIYIVVLVQLKIVVIFFYNCPKQFYCFFVLLALILCTSFSTLFLTFELNSFILIS